MNKLLKYKRLFTKLFWILPLSSNKIFFSSYEGKQYSCNPKCIFRYLKSSGRNMRYVWEYNTTPIPEDLKSNVIIVKHNSFLYFLHLLTSKYIITNSGISASVSIRESQICVNTWHGGGAYKKVGTLIDQNINGTSYKELSIIANQTTYFVSSSQKFTDIMIPSTLVSKEKFLNIGMPRNDIFLQLGQEYIFKIRKCMGLPSNVKIVLFAPTYRGESGNTEYNILMPDISMLLCALSRRFGGDWIFLYRTHYYKKEEKDISNIIDVSKYSDMQDLLCIADVLITDYSSSIWDYSLTFKPCFLFVPDLDEYITTRGGFYSDINTWPGIVSKDMQNLCKNIVEFDEQKYKYKILQHHNDLGSFEYGTATKTLVDILKL